MEIQWEDKKKKLSFIDVRKLLSEVGKWVPTERMFADEITHTGANVCFYCDQGCISLRDSITREEIYRPNPLTWLTFLVKVYRLRRVVGV